MAGRFPLYTDADIHGPIVEALIQRGWDVLRAVDRFRQATDDSSHFDEAVQQGRVLVSNDSDMKVLAERRLEDLARQDDPFGAYPIIYIKPRR